jgi:hypothetical protein
MDVMQRAGLAVLWLDNQSGCKGVCDRVPKWTPQPGAPALCPGGECLDGVMLTGWTQRIAALDPSGARAAWWWCCTRWAATALPITSAHPQPAKRFSNLNAPASPCKLLARGPGERL